MAILNYSGHLVFLNIILYMGCNSLKLYIYILSGIQIIILSKVVHFLLKRKCGILYFNGHVTYDLPMTPKIKLLSKIQ